MPRRSDQRFAGRRFGFRGDAGSGGGSGGGVVATVSGGGVGRGAGSESTGISSLTGSCAVPGSAGSVEASSRRNMRIPTVPSVEAHSAIVSTTAQSWLLPTISNVTGAVSVGVNASGLSAGTYTGTVVIVTTQGSINVQATLVVGVVATMQPSPTVLTFAHQVRFRTKPWR